MAIYIKDTSNGIRGAVFDIMGKMDAEGPSLLKESGDVYIKVNGVHSKPHCYTDPEVLKAVIQFFNEKGARKVHVMENSSLGNVTRLVFNLTGYKRVCKETGAKAIHLDEERTRLVEVRDGFELNLPKTVADLADSIETTTYVNLPKLKTHNMAVVTLGMKNQYGFVSHKERTVYHDTRLHAVLSDLLEYIKPDITLIDGTEALCHGNIPVIAFKDEIVKKYNILVGGRDTVAADVVGARILGYGVDDVPVLKLARERGLGETDLSKIDISGLDPTSFTERCDWEPYPRFPEDVKIIKGKEKLCLEGCESNPLLIMQFMTYDNRGKGDFFIVMGKGFDDDLVDQLRADGYTRGLVAGKCAVEDVGSKLQAAFGKKNVYFSRECNHMPDTISALVKLMGVPTLDLAPTSTFKSLMLIISAKLHGSKAIVPALF